MRKILSMLLALAMTVSMLAACNNEPVDDVENPNDQQQEDIQPETPEKETVKVEQWLANEIEFVSLTTYENPVYTVDMDVIFTNTSTGKTFTMPAFWDGGTSWKVRYALTELGDWTWTTVCTDETNMGLHGLSGEVTCVEYTGDLDLYKHGFVKTEPGKRYFVYDDGTPFFYLGDTHWTLPLENIDGINPDVPYERVMISQETADQYGITSMFKYIMDYRAEQGFTVIQSQQLGLYNGVSGPTWLGDAEGTIYKYGVNDMILEKFQELDRYFAYIAEKGLVHAHTQLTYKDSLVDSYLPGDISKEDLESLCRYWVARYSAYPVMWLTCQEGDDNCCQYEPCTRENNPWPIVLEAIAKYDPYKHPSSCHQENANYIAVEDSIFGHLDAHTFYAAQYDSPHENGKQLSWTMLKEYWNQSGMKPVINSEGYYDHYMCGSMRARSQGWIAFTNGQYGYGYGSQPIWSLVWGGADNYTVPEDRVETWTLDLNWVEGLYSDVSTQLIYMKDFFEKFEWWKLEPCFNKCFYTDDYYYKNAGQNYSVTTIENKLYIGYFYGKTFNNDKLGSFHRMENADYEVVWMNCITGEYTEPQVVTITDGTYNIPAKPNDDDWVIAVKLIEE